MLVENAKVHAESDSENIKLIVQDWLYESGFGKCLLRNNKIIFLRKMCTKMQINLDYSRLCREQSRFIVFDKSL